MVESLKDRAYSGEKRTELRDDRELNTRKRIAELIHASYNEICMVSSTSEGINIIARGLNLKKGDNVVLAEYEFPANVVPWLNLKKDGVEIKKVKSEYGQDPTRKIFDAVDKNTKVLTLSFVEWIDGFKFNLEEVGNFCKEKGIIFVVDGIQGTGVLELDVKASHISFLSAGGFKWLISPTGTGFIYVNKNILPEIDLKYLSYQSITSSIMHFDFNLNLKEDATRFRLGAISDTGIAAMEKSMELILEIGIETIQKQVLDLTGYAATELEKKGYTVMSTMEPENRSGILSFDGKDIREKYKKLVENNVILSLRNNWIRIAPHFYNNRDDVDKMLEFL